MMRNLKMTWYIVQDNSLQLIWNRVNPNLPSETTSGDTHFMIHAQNKLSFYLHPASSPDSRKLREAEITRKRRCWQQCCGNSPPTEDQLYDRCSGNIFSTEILLFKGALVVASDNSFRSVVFKKQFKIWPNIFLMKTLGRGGKASTICPFQNLLYLMTELPFKHLEC